MARLADAGLCHQHNRQAAGKGPELLEYGYIYGLEAGDTGGDARNEVVIVNPHYAVLEKGYNSTFVGYTHGPSKVRSSVRNGGIDPGNESEREEETETTSDLEASKK